MRILMDTHIFLWALVNDFRLTADARSWIMNPQNELVFSVASVWEISIKHGLRKGLMPISGKQAMSYAREAGYTFLPIGPEHAAAVENLPDLHKDPFDRMLITQALIEPLRLMTHDRQLVDYAPSLVILV